jgi:WD40 repeat protein
LLLRRGDAKSVPEAPVVVDNNVGIVSTFAGARALRVGSPDRTIHIWDLNANNLIRTRYSNVAIALSSSSVFVVAAGVDQTNVVAKCAAGRGMRARDVWSTNFNCLVACRRVA